jgi:hypothetical protein
VVYDRFKPNCLFYYWLLVSASLTISSLILKKKEKLKNSGAYITKTSIFNSFVNIGLMMASEAETSSQ